MAVLGQLAQKDKNVAKYSKLELVDTPYGQGTGNFLIAKTDRTAEKKNIDGSKIQALPFAANHS